MEASSAAPTPVEGPAFPPLVKLLAGLLLAALAFWGWRAADRLAAADWTWPGALLLAAAIACIVLAYYWMVRSRTTVSATHIRQSWIWPKQVALDDIAQAKLIAVPRLEWLFAPRLVVRVRGQGVQVFHAADAAVLRAFVRLCMGAAPL